MYENLAYAHLATVVPPFLIGTVLLFRKKGTPIHRLLGKIFSVLMIVTALITLFMEARVGPTLFDHFGFIHLFSVLVLYLVPSAILKVRSGDIKGHRSDMVGVYIGGLVIAGSFAFMPGRLLHQWIFL